MLNPTKNRAEGLNPASKITGKLFDGQLNNKRYV